MPTNEANVGLESTDQGTTQFIQEARHDTSIIGKWFMGPNANRVEGLVLAEYSPTFYLVQVYAWMLNKASVTKLVRLETMVEEGWMFFNVEQWLETDCRPMRPTTRMFGPT